MTFISTLSANLTVQKKNMSTFFLIQKIVGMKNSSKWNINFSYVMDLQCVVSGFNRWRYMQIEYATIYYWMGSPLNFLD